MPLTDTLFPGCALVCGFHFLQFGIFILDSIPHYIRTPGHEKHCDHALRVVSVDTYVYCYYYGFPFGTTLCQLTSVRTGTTI